MNNVSFRDYPQDFGVSKMAEMVLLYTFAMFSLSFFIGTLFSENILLFFISLLFIVSSRRIAFSEKMIFLAQVVLLVAVMLSIYEWVGKVDFYVGGMKRFDKIAHDIDLMIFGINPALYIQQFTSLWPLIWQHSFYDLLMMSYFLYFFLPFVIMLTFFVSAQEEEKFFIGRITMSYIIMFLINFSFYLIIPISGPIDYLHDLYPSPLPFGHVSGFLFKIIADFRNNFIDCFPSGHAGASLLSLFWAFRLNLIIKWGIALVTVFILMAVFMLRFHYFIDVFCSIILVLTSYYLARFFYPWGVRSEMINKN